MKILLVTHNWFGEGTCVRALQLGRGLVQLGHQVTLLATSTRPFSGARFEDGGVQVCLAPHFRDTHRGGWGWLDLPWRSAFAATRRFDLVHAFDHKPNVVLPAWIQTVLKGVPLVSDWADWWSGEEGVNRGARTFKAWVEARSEVRVRRLAGWVTAISPLLVERAKSLGLPPSQIMLLPGGGDVQRIRPLARASCRRSLGLDAKAVYGVYLGLGSADLPLVLQGLALARRKNPKLRLMLLGPDEEQKKRLAKEAGVEAWCVIPGRVPDQKLGTWLGGADFGLIPLSNHLANRARWPNKVGEYGAAGLPVLANPVGPLATLLKKEKAGFLCASSAAGFSAGMLKLAAAPAARRAAGKRARKWVLRDLDWRQLAVKLDGFYRRRLEAVRR